MPSVFPGMDPFLEHPAIFPGFHDRFTAYISEFLQSRLPAPYYADIGDRVWVEVSQRLIGPDVDVLKRNGGAQQGNAVNGGVAVAAPRSKPVVVHVPHDERRETFVDIYSRLDEGERLVTTIEVLSLSNKRSGDPGRELYQRKQREVLSSQVHLVEIDLLRGGTHTTAVLHDRAWAKAGPYDYHVCIHRFDNLEDFFIYPIQITERLPEIAVPLLPADGSIALDLQAVFERCYEVGPYRRRIRYNDPASIVPPLPAEKMEWVQQVLTTNDLA
jgi:hypothetical protein